MKNLALIILFSFISINSFAFNQKLTLVSCYGTSTDVEVTVTSNLFDGYNYIKIDSNYGINLLPETSVDVEWTRLGLNASDEFNGVTLVAINPDKPQAMHQPVQNSYVSLSYHGSFQWYDLSCNFDNYDLF